MGLNIPDPTHLTLEKWASRLLESNPSNFNIPVTPPLEQRWQSWANQIAFEDFRYPGANTFSDWKSWAKVLYELEIV